LRFAIVGLAVVGLFVSAAAASSFANQAQLRAGVDADIAGNSGTQIGDVQDCVEVAVGDEFQVDVFVEDVSDMEAFQYFLVYDPAIVNIIGANSTGDGTFLASGESGPLADFNQFDAGTEDTDGEFGGAAADFGDTESGEGVLTRIDLRAVGSGQSQLSLEGFFFTTPPAIPIAPGPDGLFFRGPILNAAVSVGGSCEPPEQPTIAPTYSPTAAPPTSADGGTGGPTDDGDGQSPGATDGTGNGTASPNGDGNGNGNGDNGANGSDDDDGGGATLWIILGVVAAAIVIIGGGALALRRRGSE
jgi:hypothetical protein